ncbi:hypothetical protein M407DRAFT_26735 [Tulasnella calospora MUT 4182]|uniref:Heparinase II N-terminal domain-containing protein n=1 Tax=Tulasnella calospora MUT 4182 TaxID=1051891 RepID=A0A0C3QDR6_9AGAM|nr:hypothetical protein M407DRAFT_26735 [Tulasnella calospora MUT 4182]
MDPVPYDVDGGLNNSGVLDEDQGFCVRLSRDWADDLYDAWTGQQKETIRTAIVTLGLQYGLEVYTNNAAYGWWTTAHGNRNCVCNGGLTMGALAILGDNTTNTAARILNYTIPNAVANLLKLVRLYGLENFLPITGLYHMYVSGNRQLFDYGDHGPTKYSATANATLLHSTKFQKPEYALFQRDRPDAAEPWSMFWYDPAVSGACSGTTPHWASMRTSWTDINGWYVVMKTGALTGHASYGNLDGGEFVIDYAGARRAGELDSGDYIAKSYFNSEAQDSPRWSYYRPEHPSLSTNKISLSPRANLQARVFRYLPRVEHRLQRSLRLDGYVHHGFNYQLRWNVNQTWHPFPRWPNSRTFARRHHQRDRHRQWTHGYAHPDDKSIYVHILDAPTSVAFEAHPAQRCASDPAMPTGMTDQPNPGVTVLAINIQPGTYSLQVLFDPMWSGQDAVDYKPPTIEPVDQWSATSHG